MIPTTPSARQTSTPGAVGDVLIEYHGNGRVDLVIHRPERHNAFHAGVILRLREALDELASRPDLRVLVLRSSGAHFSAGADLQWMRDQASASETENLDDAMQLARLMQCLDLFPTPVIARVQGNAFGGALGLIACADLAIGSEDSLFCLSEVKLGLVPAVISPYVQRAIGTRQMRRYALTAERLDATTAQAIGLLHTVVPASALDEAVAAQVETLCRNAPLAVREAKALLRRVNDGFPDEALIRETAGCIARLRVGSEGQEGLAAFLNRRTPQWQTDTPDETTTPGTPSP